MELLRIVPSAGIAVEGSVLIAAGVVALRRGHPQTTLWRRRHSRSGKPKL
jgi:hypothetical protein